LEPSTDVGREDGGDAVVLVILKVELGGPEERVEARGEARSGAREVAVTVQHFPAPSCAARQTAQADYPDRQIEREATGLYFDRDRRAGRAWLSQKPLSDPKIRANTANAQLPLANAPTNATTQMTVTQTLMASATLLATATVRARPFEAGGRLIGPVVCLLGTACGAVRLGVVSDSRRRNAPSQPSV
jgi:hypothetical protein